jgi:hypothetical protein
MELSKLAGQAVELWGEGHGFADGASRLPGKRLPDPHCKPAAIYSGGKGKNR